MVGLLGLLSDVCGGEFQPGRQVEEAHQQVHRGHAADAGTGGAQCHRGCVACGDAGHDREGGRRRQGQPAGRATCLPGLCCCGRCHFPVPDRLSRTGCRAGRQPGESDKCDGISMDSLITAAARALAAGDPLAALNRVALRDDPLALALRGIAMAQLGDIGRS
jgi:hypothetical protein